MMVDNGEITQSLLNNGVPRLGSRTISACVLAEGTTDADKQQRYKKTQRKLLLALVLAFIFMIVEVAGGIYAHSLAIITDAAHLLSDVSGFAVSAFASYYAVQKSHQHFSYGYHRVEVLGALASVMSVWVVTGILLWEAVQRIFTPEPVNGKIMFIIAVVGVFVNLGLMLILGGHGHAHGGHSHSKGDKSHSDHHKHGDHDHQHHHEDLEEGARAGDSHPGHSNGHVSPHGNASHDHEDGNNMNLRGAIIHVIGDLVQSLGVALAGALIWYHQDDPRWALADPICTFLFAAVVLWTTFSIVKDIADVLMERTPRGQNVEEIYQDLVDLEGVEDVHDLHVWSLTPGIPLLCAHVSIAVEADAGEVLLRVTRYCRGLGIEHTTIQLMVVGDGEVCTCGAAGSLMGNSAGSSRRSLLISQASTESRGNDGNQQPAGAAEDR